MNNEENIIKDNVKPILTFKQKMRYTSASQHFMKGMHNYLKKYITQIKELVDTKQVKENYQKQYKKSANEYVERFQQAEERIQDERRPIKVYLGMFIAGGFIFYQILKRQSEVFRQKSEKFITFLKQYSSIALDESINLLSRFGKWASRVFGYVIDAYQPLKKITNGLIEGISNVFGKNGILGGFWTLFSSDIWNQMLWDTAATAYNLSFETSWGYVLSMFLSKAKLAKQRSTAVSKVARVSARLGDRYKEVQQQLKTALQASNFGLYVSQADDKQGVIYKDGAQYSGMVKFTEVYQSIIKQGYRQFDFLANPTQENYHLLKQQIDKGKRVVRDISSLPYVLSKLSPFQFVQQYFYGDDGMKESDIYIHSINLLQETQLVSSLKESVGTMFVTGANDSDAVKLFQDITKWQIQKMKKLTDKGLDIMKDGSMHSLITGADQVVTNILSSPVDSHFQWEGDDEYDLQDVSDKQIYIDKERGITLRIKGGKSVEKKQLKIRGKSIYKIIQNVRKYYQKYKNNKIDETIKKVNTYYLSNVYDWSKTITSESNQLVTIEQVQHLFKVRYSYIFVNHVEEQFAIRSAGIAYHGRMLVSHMDVRNQEMYKLALKQKREMMSQTELLYKKFNDYEIDYYSFMDKMIDKLNQFTNSRKLFSERDILVEYQLARSFEIYKVASYLRNIRNQLRTAYQMMYYGVGKDGVYTFSKDVSNAALNHGLNEENEEVIEGVYKQYDPKKNPQGIDKGYKNHSNGVAHDPTHPTIYKSTLQQSLIEFLLLKATVRDKRYSLRLERKLLIQQLSKKFCVIHAIQKMYQDGYGKGDENIKKLIDDSGVFDIESGEEMIEKMAYALRDIMQKSIAEFQITQ